MHRSLLFITLMAIGSVGMTAPWTYRGTLTDGGKPANGRYDLRVGLLQENGSAIADPITLHDVEIQDGNFAVDVDFGIDLSRAPMLRVRTEVAQGGSAFVVLGEPAAFDAKAALAGVCWDTEGNAGTNPATNFIGTTDNQPLVLRTRNAPSLRIEPSPETFGSPALSITRNMIGGSHANSVVSGVRGATVAGGGAPTGSDPAADASPNLVTDLYGTVAGGYGNRAGDDDGSVTNSLGATVGGGTRNVAHAEAVVAGGRFNSASGFQATVSGGTLNGATETAATVGGGSGNSADGEKSTVGGGSLNAALGRVSTVAGGEGNLARGGSSTVGGGGLNEASGSNSTVAGGNDNCAGGASSWAGGAHAKVRPATDPGPGNLPAPGPCTGLGSYPGGSGDNGTFVWADSHSTDFTSNGPNRFLVRAADGATFQRPIGSETSARAPRGYFNVVQGDSGLSSPASPSANVVASFESASDAFLVLTTPAGASRGLVFRSPVSNNEAGLVYASSATGLQFLSGNSVRMTLAGTGQLTLNTLGSAGSTTLCRNASNQISSCSSSARYKDRIEDLKLGLDAVSMLRPVSYQWKDGGMADVGFVAEEVAQLDERLVTRNKAGEIEGVKYDRLSAVLAGAMQELAAHRTLQGAEIDALAARLDQQQVEVDALRAELTELRGLILGGDPGT